MSVSENIQNMVITSISQSFVNILQSNVQNVGISQILDINCEKYDEVSDNICSQCMTKWATIINKDFSKLSNSDFNFIKESCQYACNCDIDKVNISNNIILDFSNLQKTDIKQKFVSDSVNDLYLSAYKNNTVLYLDSDNNRVSNVENALSDLYDKMVSNTFLSDLQQLLNIQTVTIKGASNVYNININSAINIVSNLVQKSSETVKSFNELLNKISEMTEQTVNAGLTQVISFIIKIAIGLLILIMFIFFISLGMTFLTNLLSI